LHAGTLDPIAETLLFFAARAQLLAEVIRPALGHGEIVVCDRFTDSTRAYQGFGRSVPSAVIESANIGIALEPDVKILLDVPVADGLRRASLAGNKDRFEREGTAFHERVRQGFLTLAARDSDRWHVIDAALPVDEVARKIWERIAAQLTKAEN
jgi:dTMP kinase